MTTETALSAGVLVLWEAWLSLVTPLPGEWKEHRESFHAVREC
jgi:hypothetical protein